MLTLVDLAGNERNAASLHDSDAKLIREAAQINTSLMALKNCIRARAAGEYANYRESKLTRLLQDALGGNSKTSLITSDGGVIAGISNVIVTNIPGTFRKFLFEKIGDSP